MKTPEQTAAALLKLSFADIDQKYSGLTPSERSACTRAEFLKLLQWIRLHTQESPK